MSKIRLLFSSLFGALFAASSRFSVAEADLRLVGQVFF